MSGKPSRETAAHIKMQPHLGYFLFCPRFLVFGVLTRLLSTCIRALWTRRFLQTIIRNTHSFSSDHLGSIFPAPHPSWPGSRLAVKSPIISPDLQSGKLSLRFTH